LEISAAFGSRSERPQADTGNAEDQKFDHSVAITAPEGEALPRRRAHQEREADTEHEREQTVGLEQRQSVDEPERDRVERGFASQLVKAHSAKNAMNWTMTTIPNMATNCGQSGISARDGADDARLLSGFKA
jgi:hypothetical protein